MFLIRLMYLKDFNKIEENNYIPENTPISVAAGIVYFVAQNCNLNIRFPGFDSRDLLQYLQPKIAASTGSACSTGIEEPSYVLKAIGLSSEEASQCIRFSFGIDQDVNMIIEAAKFIGQKIMDRESIMNGTR